jgi:5'/3'-nucleotidase SurE
MRIDKVLVTNDDGYNSFGIKLLTDILKNFANEIYVVAPKKNMSGSSRSISLKDEIKFQKITSTSWVVDGTPTDCVMFALNHIFKKKNLIIFFLALMLGQILVMKFHIQELLELLLKVL